MEGRPRDLYLQYVTRETASARILLGRMKKSEVCEKLNARVEDRWTVEGASKIAGVDTDKHGTNVRVALTCLQRGVSDA